MQQLGNSISAIHKGGLAATSGHVTTSINCVGGRTTQCTLVTVTLFLSVIIRIFSGSLDTTFSVMSSAQASAIWLMIMIFLIFANCYHLSSSSRLRHSCLSIAPTFCLRGSLCCAWHCYASIAFSVSGQFVKLAIGVEPCILCIFARHKVLYQLNKIGRYLYGLGLLY